MKKKIKPPLVLRMVSWIFPKVERLAPWLAHRWFVRIFFTPLRYKMPYGEVEMREKAEKFNIIYEGKKIQCYRWGNGKPVLMVHGWMGRGTQFRKFIPAFNDSGFQVISFDATGHGKSEGKRSHLMEFSGIIDLLQQSDGPFEMIIGHSLGGAAALHSIQRALATERLIMISTPTLGDKIVGEFLHRLNATRECLVYFNAYILKKFGKEFHEYDACCVAQTLRNINLLLIYDRDDHEVKMENAVAFLEIYPQAQLFTTETLGHTRILKDQTVIDTCLKFLQKKPVLLEV